MCKVNLIIALGLFFILLPSLTFAVTGDVVVSFATPGTCPTGMTFDGKNLWVLDHKSDSLYSIDPSNGTVIKGLASPGYKSVGLTWDGNNLWILDEEENLIFQLDPKSGLAKKTIYAPSPTPRGLGWDGKYLWVTDSRADKIFQISTEDGTTIKTIPSPSGVPQGVCFDGKYLWISDRYDDKIFMITPDDGDVIICFDSPGPYSRGIAWDGEFLWNVDYQTDSLYKIKIFDDEIYSQTKKKVEFLEFTNEFRNYGPGTVKDLDIYLAVPQDLNNQKLLEEISFDPDPSDILTDKWGQKVAHYHFEDLENTEFIRVGMEMKAEIFDLQYFIFPEKVGTLNDIPKKIKDRYLVNDTKYAIDDPFIKKSARDAIGDEKNPYWIARKIFSYVIDKMHYELAGGWNIAPTVLKRGSGSCSEYSFVYIALCRVSGLPARYAGSVAIRGDDASTDDVFHRWVEVYLPNYGWIPVDPSGGDRDTPHQKSQAFGHLANRYLITTLGGGGSEYLEWGYNSNERWSSLGKCKIFVEHIGEWSPLAEE
jgi:transglutaminase-like putative cysteine protease